MDAALQTGCDLFVLSGEWYLPEDPAVYELRANSTQLPPFSTPTLVLPTEPGTTL